MNVKEAKLLFKAGALREPTIKRHAEEGGWIAVLEGKHPLNPALEAARGHVRVFRTVDAAVAVLVELGFESMKVVPGVGPGAPEKTAREINDARKRK